MHEKVLPQGSRKLLDALGRMRHGCLKNWVLAGGTGLALHLGHRVSEDFDFFRTDDLDLRQLHKVLRGIGKYEILQESEDTLTVIVLGIKISFFRIRDPFIYPAKPYSFFAVADLRDIALMKLAAISGRGSRKDFIDLYTILRFGPSLRDYFSELPKKYRKDRVNAYHILKSLTYFEDAEQEPMPRMLEPFDWKECKDFFVRQAHSIIMPP